MITSCKRCIRVHFINALGAWPAGPYSNALDTVSATAGSDLHACAAATRANLNCNLALSWIGGAPGSASCLRFDPLYYQACPSSTTLFPIDASDQDLLHWANVSTAQLAACDALNGPKLSA